MEIDRNNRFAESLSFRGNTIASSYLKDEIIRIMPTNERYTEKVPKTSGEKYLRRKGWSKIEMA